MKKKPIDRLLEGHKEWNKVDLLNINGKVAAANSERFWKQLIARKNQTTKTIWYAYAASVSLALLILAGVYSQWFNDSLIEVVASDRVVTHLMPDSSIVSIKPGLCTRSSITSLTHFKSVALLCLPSHHSGAMLSKSNCLIYGDLKPHNESYCIIRVKPDSALSYHESFGKKNKALQFIITSSRSTVEVLGFSFLYETNIRLVG